MKRLIVQLIGTIAVLGLVSTGCAQSTPSPAPATAPPAQPKAAEPTKASAVPTKAPAVQPTAMPAAKVDFPAKGKTITIIVPLAAGGSTDINARLTAPPMEKELGVPVQIVNRPGAGQQTGLTEVARVASDGYTLTTLSIPSALSIYLDPARKAVFGRKSFEPVANQTRMAFVLAVTPGSPFKTTKDVFDAAKANPNKIRFATDGLLSANHLIMLELQRRAGAQLAMVHFSGGGEALPALLGGHVDVGLPTVAQMPGLVKEGKLRALGIADPKENSALPGVTTLASQGYPGTVVNTGGIAAPAGTPKEIVTILSQAIKKAMDDPQYKQQTAELGFTLEYLDAAGFAKYWDESEATVAALVQQALSERK